MKLAQFHLVLYGLHFIFESEFPNDINTIIEHKFFQDACGPVIAEEIVPECSLFMCTYTVLDLSVQYNM